MRVLEGKRERGRVLTQSGNSQIILDDRLIGSVTPPRHVTSACRPANQLTQSTSPCIRRASIRYTANSPLLSVHLGVSSVASARSREREGVQVVANQGLSDSSGLRMSRKPARQSCRRLRPSVRQYNPPTSDTTPCHIELGLQEYVACRRSLLDRP